MFIQITLLNGFAKPLWYQVPPDWATQDLDGTIIQVPLRNRIVPALVIKQVAHKPNVPFAIKQAQNIEAFPADRHYLPFIKKLSAYHQIEPIHFLKRVRGFLDAKTPTCSLLNSPKTNATNVQLTDEQQKAVDFVTPHVIKPQYTPTVLHGVTGSGKTEVYKQLMLTAIAEQKTTLLLLPEVTLALAFEQRLQQELPDDVVVRGFHSGTTPKQKRELWSLLIAQQPIILVGVHLPALLPIANLGLIVVDEEHAAGYQEKKHPKIHTRDIAIWRAQQYGVPIILGSATPSLQTLYNVKEKNWHFFQLKKRFAGAFPKVKTVLLTDKKQRKNFWISDALRTAIAQRLAKNEQTIIFLNRRGFSFFVQCTLCSFIFTCTSCSVSLTLHSDNRLTCHYCGRSMHLPEHCLSCKAPDEKLLKKGIGTQQVVTIIQKLFPQARIARADLDTSVKKKKLQETMQQFADKKLDILVGTQTITKGFDFPGVTLVGVIWADISLNFPLFNAAETTLQQLIQVAGRAGRYYAESTVIIQAMLDHTIFEYVNEVDYVKFYHNELAHRKELNYPPYKRLTELELKNRNEQQLEKDAHAVMQHLIAYQQQNNITAQILGPAKPPVHKIKNTHSRKIYIKSDGVQESIMLYQSIDTNKLTSSLFFTPNPVT